MFIRRQPTNFRPQTKTQFLSPPSLSLTNRRYWSNPQRTEQDKTKYLLDQRHKQHKESSQEEELIFQKSNHDGTTTKR